MRWLMLGGWGKFDDAGGMFAGLLLGSVGKRKNT